MADRYIYAMIPIGLEVSEDRFNSYLERARSVDCSDWDIPNFLFVGNTCVEMDSLGFEDGSLYPVDLTDEEAFEFLESGELINSWGVHSFIPASILQRH